MIHVRQTANILLILVLLEPHSVESIFPWDSIAGALLNLFFGNANPFLLNGTDPRLVMTTEQLIQYHGYPFENHQVTTEDGYILELHRIPHTKSSNLSSQTTPVIMVPGLLADSGCYVTIGELNSPGFVLSDAGYDVWLHNNRGTRYSRKHTNLLPDKQREYWNYSFHEMGVYDLTASVDHILSTTKATQVYIIGHSMGGAIASIFIAERPSHNSKVKAVFLLSPAIGLKKTRMMFAHKPNLSKKLLLLFDEMEILPYNDNTLLLISNFCNDPTYNELFTSIVQLVFQPGNTPGIAKLPSFSVSRILSGTCVKVLRHFLQLANRNYFSKYDYGPQENMEIYGQKTAPSYPLENTIVPVFVFHADNDDLVISSDIVDISQNFANLIETIDVPDKTFGHLDFVISSKAKILVYDTIINRMSTVSNSEQSEFSEINMSFLFVYGTLLLLIILLIVLFLKLNDILSSK